MKTGTENFDKKVCLSSTPISFVSANDSVTNLSQSFSSLVMTDNQIDPMDVLMGGGHDIVNIICVELIELNGEELKSPMLNAYDALVLFRFWTTFWFVSIDILYPSTFLLNPFSHLIRQVFSIAEEPLFGIAIIKNPTRGIGFNFPLKKAISIYLSNYTEFEFKLNEDIYKGRLFTPTGRPRALGEDVQITVKKNCLSIDKRSGLTKLTFT